MRVSSPIAPSVGEAAYRHIRADIIFGRLPPGQKLRLDRLKGDLGVSVSTLREILTRLAAEGFVTAEGQKGFEVPPLTAEGLRELADLRRLLESHALAQSFAVGDVEWEGRVVAAHHKLETAERRLLAGGAGTELWKRYDWEFHQALMSACGSQELMRAHANAFDRYLRYLIVALCFRGDDAAHEHRALREAALIRDVETAQRILGTHIEACVDFALGSGLLDGRRSW